MTELAKAASGASSRSGVDRRCRFCSAPLHVSLVDLKCSPLANSLLDANAASRMEPFYPLHAFVCDQCFLVQLEAFEAPECIFSNYLYFSSFSESWLDHADRYCRLMRHRFGIRSDSMVVEVGSNDGYLLRNFVCAGIPVLGIEAAANVAEVARSQGVPTKTAFFGAREAEILRAGGYAADLICANNVLAHVPDINDFVDGFRILLKPQGVATFEFPHLLRLIIENQFDTIYHEHFSYLSLLTVERIFAAHSLVVFDVEELPTHGGSLRIYAAHIGARQIGERVATLRAKEHGAGLDRLDTYADFRQEVVRVKCELLKFLIEAKQDGRQVAGYGAPAKGNTLLNYCGIGPELLPFTVDRNPYKQGLLLPGARVPIRAPEAIFEAKPDFILILPWNLKAEIMEQMSAVQEFNARFVTAIPRVQIY
jgi:SAM-dependent methyltransferase